MDKQNNQGSKHFLLLTILTLLSATQLQAQTDIWTALSKQGYSAAKINAIRTGQSVLTIQDDGQLYRVTYTGSYVDLKIPDNVTHKYLQLTARGGDGGNRINKALITPFKTKGGGGATVVGYLKTGTGTTEIPPGAVLRFISGSKGETYVGLDTHGTGGGGGTGVFMKRPGSNSWVTLMVAGAGGGAYSDCCTIKSEGHSASSGTDGTDSGGLQAGSGGTGGADGERSHGIAGGGLNGAIFDGVPRGSALVDDDGNKYHFGCGQGSGLDGAGGGGGGYSGGGGGGIDAGGGGGGSFLNAILDGSIYINEKTHDPKHGYIDFQFIDRIGNHISLAKNPSKCIDVRDETVQSGSNVQLYDCQEGGSQSWTFEGQMIRFFRNMNQCLEIQGSNPYNGANVEVWGCNNGTNAQKWVYDGVKRLIRSARNLDKCLDLVNGVTDNGTNIQIWDCKSIGAQQWLINGAVTSPTPASLQTIHSLYSSGKCMDLKGGQNGGSANGTNVQLWTCYDGNARQQWYFNGSQIKFNADQNKCLELQGSDPYNGANVEIWTCNTSTNAQKWIYDGLTKTIRSGLDLNKCIHIKDASKTNGANLELWTCSESKTSQFEIK